MPLLRYNHHYPHYRRVHRHTFTAIHTQHENCVEVVAMVVVVVVVVVVMVMVVGTQSGNGTKRTSKH